MVMDRSHPEQPQLSPFIVPNLQNNRQLLRKIDEKQNWNQNLDLLNDSQNGKGATDRQRSCIAHKRSCRINIVEEKPKQTADHDK
jgi:hypothetical protein